MRASQITIVGAGPAGLTAAIAARLLGFDVRVVEQAPSFARVGGGIALQSNGLRVLATLGVLADFTDAMVLSNRVVIVEPGGRVLADMNLGSASFPQPRLAVLLRADLQERLLAAATRLGVAVEFGKRCSSASQGARGIGLGFADGTARDTEIVLAADGVRSCVRGGLGLVATRYQVGEAALRGVAEIPCTATMPREIWLPNGQRFGLAPMTGARTYFYCSVPLGAWDAIRNQRLPEWIASWEPLLPEAVPVLRAVRTWDAVNYDELQTVSLRHWWRGAGFVLGDAAHAMTPDLGQGANAAMVDALVLMRLLAAEADLARVGRQYQRLRRTFVTRTQWTARLIGRLAAWRSPGGRIVRRVLLGVGQLPPFARQNQAVTAGYQAAETPYFMPLSHRVD